MEDKEEGLDDIDGAIFTRYKFAVSVDESESGYKIRGVPNDEILDCIIDDMQADINLDEIEETADDSTTESRDDVPLTGKTASPCKEHIDTPAVDLTDSQILVGSLPELNPLQTADEISSISDTVPEPDDDGVVVAEKEELIKPEKVKTLHAHNDSADLSIASRSSRQCLQSGEGQKDIENNDKVIFIDSSKPTCRRGVKFCCKIALALIVPAIGMLLFLADIGTDIYLALSYKNSGDIDLFCITVGCIIIPSIILAVVDISWVRLDAERCTCNFKTVCRIIVGIFSLGRIWRAISYMYNIVKAMTEPDSSKARSYKKRQLAQKRDCYILDFINAFTESCPQLIVQLYLFYKFDLELNFSRTFSLLSSWVCIAWTYASHYRSHREAKTQHLEPDVTFIGFILYFLAILAALAARVCCLVLLMVFFNIFAGIGGLVAHYILMIAWIVYQKPDLEGLLKEIKKFTFGRFMYYLFFSYVSCFCFVNLKDTKARGRIMVFYALFYFENFVMAGLVIWKLLSSHTEIEKIWNLLFLGVGMAIHLLCLLAYYHFFHPSVGTLRNTKLCCATPCCKAAPEEVENDDVGVEIAMTTQNKV